MSLKATVIKWKAYDGEDIDKTLTDPNITAEFNL